MGLLDDLMDRGIKAIVRWLEKLAQQLAQALRLGLLHTRRNPPALAVLTKIQVGTPLAGLGIYLEGSPQSSQIYVSTPDGRVLIIEDPPNNAPSNVSAKLLANPIKLDISCGPLVVNSNGNVVCVVTNYGVRFVDGTQRQMAGSPIGASGIQNITLNNKTGLAYATTRNNIIVINSATYSQSGNPISIISPSGQPRLFGVAMDESLNRIYVATVVIQGNGSVYVVSVIEYDPNSRTHAVMQGTGLPIPVGPAPAAVEVDQKSHLVYVSHFGSPNPSLTVIDGGQTPPVVFAANVPVGTNPRAIAVDSEDGYVYVANQGGSLSIIDGRDLHHKKTIPVAHPVPTPQPVQVAFNPVNRRVYVADQSGYVLVLS